FHRGALAACAAAIVELIDRLHPALDLRDIPDRSVDTTGDGLCTDLVYLGSRGCAVGIGCCGLNHVFAGFALMGPTTFCLDLQRIELAGRDLDVLVADDGVLG